MSVKLSETTVDCRVGTGFIHSRRGIQTDLKWPKNIFTFSKTIKVVFKKCKYFIFKVQLLCSTLLISGQTGNAFGIWICGCRCILECSGSQNQRVHIVLEASKSAGAKGDVPNTYLRVRAPAAPVLTHSLTKVVLRFEGPNWN